MELTCNLSVREENKDAYGQIESSVSVLERLVYSSLRFWRYCNPSFWYLSSFPLSLTLSHLVRAQILLKNSVISLLPLLLSL